MAVQKTYSSEKEIAEIWKLFRENERRIKETGLQMKETDRQIKENDRKMNRRIKALDELFNGQWGKLMESLVEGDLIKLLRERKIKVEATLTNLKGRCNGERTEFDIVAINGEEVVVVEVKTTLGIGDVKYFIKKLERFKEWRSEFRDKKIYGAVAYLKANSNSDVYAERQKLFVIRATGSSASITNAKNFKPKIFS